MSRITDLVNRLDNCPAGDKGWREFEDLCVEILELLFVPPLIRPIIQARTYSGTNRRDAVFPNRNFDEKHNWGLLLRELEARMVLFEFKNYDKMEIGSEEVIQTENYLTEPMGRLAIMVCSKLPNNGAHIQRNNIYSRRRKVILFITKEHLKEMLFLRERGEDPCDLIVDRRIVTTASNDNTAKVWRVGGLDELLTRGCDWLQEYFVSHPEARENLRVCKAKA